MEKAELEKLIADALRAEHSTACPIARRRIALARRLCVVLGVMLTAHVIGEVMHLELLHEGVKFCADGVCAFVVEKVCSMGE